ncbi:MAG TPA: cysteine--tRNA ligase [Candidatus Paceibacterota bacterium]|jgi:cysteinyl-tRNA synthetase|nr:cysteine--tRNA ligase [Candidatus Paceibacterota bacterium]
MIKLYNTLSGKKEALPEVPKLRLFVCGPTVYDHPHIGNARTFVTFDLFVRYLRSRRLNVFYLQNITDVDDKIIDRAREENTTWDVIARRYEDIYKKNMKDLGVIAVDCYARATDFIPEIVAQVKILINKKRAYLIEGDGWYFDLSTFPDYGKLAHRTAAQAEDATSRIDTSDRKRNRGDFALWKFSKPPDAAGTEEPSWPDNDLGAGRPGWHIEDTAISDHFFGPQYELHGGAIDLKFPHHEAEIAQQESASGLAPFVKIWMHSGFLTVNGEKMSKSLKNFVTIDEMLGKYSPDIFRMVVLMSHYRSPLDYTDELAKTAQKNLWTLGAFAKKLGMVSERTAEKPVDKGSTDSQFFAKAMAALDDDFNTPQALGAIFEVVSKNQKKVWELEPTEAFMIAQELAQIFETFGIALPNPGISEKARELAEEREKFRSNKQFAQSDRLRKEIEGVGYEIEDTPQGPFLWPTQKNHT